MKNFELYALHLNKHFLMLVVQIGFAAIIPDQGGKNPPQKLPGSPGNPVANRS